MAFVQTGPTLTYSESSQGFPSFYDYAPDFIIGMNQYLYTFKGGKLYRHNTNDTRNNFYGTQYTSKITSIFNEAPLQNKIFKTLNLEGDHAWDATIVSDIQTTGRIDYEWFEKKEDAWFGFVRNDGPEGADTNETEWELRSLNGIGNSDNTTSLVGTIATFSFPTTVNIGSIISVGDNVYYAVPPAPPSTGPITPIFAGRVTEINVDLPSGINNIKVETNITGAVPPTVGVIYYVMYIKNPIAESHGILGHFAEFTLELPSTVTGQSELFAVESEIMKSFP